MSRIFHRLVALPVGNGPVEPAGRYEFGWYGHVDFGTRQADRCGCGGCCVAERIPEGVRAGKFEAAGLAWLEAIRAGRGEPTVYRIVDFGGCACCGGERTSCGCEIATGYYADVCGAQKRHLRVCTTHRARIEE